MGPPFGGEKGGEGETPDRPASPVVVGTGIVGGELTGLQTHGGVISPFRSKMVVNERVLKDTRMKGCEVSCWW